MIGMDLILGIGAVAGAVVALFTAAMLGVRIATKIAAPFFAEAVRQALAPKLDHINSELSVNGGKSVKDTTIQTAAAVSELAEAMREFREYQTNRNHDILNKQITTVTVMKLLHRQQLREMGWSEEDLEDLVIVPDRRRSHRGPPDDQERRNVEE